MHVFIDANKMLTFYDLSASDLAELEKLIALVKGGTIVLHLPDQVVNEVRRNRGKVLAQLRKVLSDARLQAPLPKSSDQFPETGDLRESLKEAQKKHSDLISAFDKAAASRTLAADKHLEVLFKAGAHVDTGPVVEKARLRHERGQPPGKGSHIGDELNWESLVHAVPAEMDLHIVSDDNDFYSALVREEIHESLADEWRASKKAQIFGYRQISDFTRLHFPAIEFASDIEKVKHIQRLASSSSFAETHAVVARLAQYSLFTPAQAAMLIDAAAGNSQVCWIASDNDVQDLLARVIAAHRASLPEPQVARLETNMYPQQPTPAEDDAEVPF
jgi:hypothetical protein